MTMPIVLTARSGRAASFERVGRGNGGRTSRRDLSEIPEVGRQEEKEVNDDDILMLKPCPPCCPHAVKLDLLQVTSEWVSGLWLVSDWTSPVRFEKPRLAGWPLCGTPLSALRTSSNARWC